LQNGFNNYWRLIRRTFLGEKEKEKRGGALRGKKGEAGRLRWLCFLEGTCGRKEKEEAGKRGGGGRREVLRFFFSFLFPSKRGKGEGEVGEEKKRGRRRRGLFLAEGGLRGSFDPFGGEGGGGKEGGFLLKGGREGVTEDAVLLLVLVAIVFSLKLSRRRKKGEKGKSIVEEKRGGGETARISTKSCHICIAQSSRLGSRGKKKKKRGSVCAGKKKGPSFYTVFSYISLPRGGRKKRKRGKGGKCRKKGKKEREGNVLFSLFIETHLF